MKRNPGRFKERPYRYGTYSKPGGFLYSGSVVYVVELPKSAHFLRHKFCAFTAYLRLYKLLTKIICALHCMAIKDYWSAKCFRRNIQHDQSVKNLLKIWPTL